MLAGMKKQETLILRYAQIVLMEVRLVKEGKKLEQELIDEKSTIESELSLGPDEILGKARQMLSL